MASLNKQTARRHLTSYAPHHRLTCHTLHCCVFSDTYLEYKSTELLDTSSQTGELFRFGGCRSVFSEKANITLPVNVYDAFPAGFRPHFYWQFPEKNCPTGSF